ncbi:hypothetical protein ACPEEZ_12675 [Frigoribacterium sp. 2-23]|uniref:hypothetical protein n=1 Tax=Frigoribacterium sp. 2-23 TaxID=3415006 RepID=UPI003C6F0310
MSDPTPPEISRPDGHSGRAGVRAGAGRRSDRADLVAALTLGLVAAGVVVVRLIVRLVEVFGGGRIAVPVTFVPTEARVAGSSVAVTVDGGTVSVGTAGPGTIVSIVLAEVVPAVAAVVVIACAIGLVRRLMDGRAFAPGTSRLVSIASMAILVGWVAATLFGTMASNGALAAASADPVDTSASFAQHVSWLPFLAAVGVGALAIAFRSGERLQVDSDGLV